MKRTVLLMTMLFLLACLNGCLSSMPGATSMLTGVSGPSYENATMAILYSEPEVIKDQSQLVTLVVSKSRYGVSIDGVPVKEFEGAFNPNLRVSDNPNNDIYIVDMLPGTHTLLVTYDANAAKNEPAATPAPGSGATVYQSGGTRVTASATGLHRFISWKRTSETTHALKGGDVYAIGLKMMTISGDIDLYPVSAEERAAVSAARDNAQFVAQNP